MSNKIKQSGIFVMPGVGFDVVPSIAYSLMWLRVLMMLSTYLRCSWSGPLG